jgi:hypothetical protein
LATCSNSSFYHFQRFDEFQFNQNITKQNRMQLMQILNNRRGNRQRGFLVIDGIAGWAIILAVVGIIATVTMTGSTAMKVGEAVTLVQSINTGTVSWSSNRTTGVSGVGVTLLSAAKYIPVKIADGVAKNPWGGDYKVTQGATIYDFIVTVTNVPPAECIQLADKLSRFTGNCNAATKEVSAAFTI